MATPLDSIPTGVTINQSLDGVEIRLPAPPEKDTIRGSGVVTVVLLGLLLPAFSVIGNELVQALVQGALGELPLLIGAAVTLLGALLFLRATALGLLEGAQRGRPVTLRLTHMGIEIERGVWSVTVPWDDIEVIDQAGTVHRTSGRRVQIVPRHSVPTQRWVHQLLREASLAYLGEGDAEEIPAALRALRAPPEITTR
ncbi:MAG: hypothetical protein AAFV53_26600 [Myxococcota bacterium]